MKQMSQFFFVPVLCMLFNKPCKLLVRHCAHYRYCTFSIVSDTQTACVVLPCIKLTKAIKETPS